VVKAGVLDNGQLSYPELGTPQDGVISPCLANVFLHYVLDEWFAAEVPPRLRGPSTLVRFADDFVVTLAHKDDAERVLRVLGKRLGEYGLESHPDKTQMIDFRFKPQSGHDDPQEPLAKTFNFLGFTHVWVT
jgi:RNA-directed DNA polymerase